MSNSQTAGLRSFRDRRESGGKLSITRQRGNRLTIPNIEGRWDGLSWKTKNVFLNRLCWSVEPSLGMSSNVASLLERMGGGGLSTTPGGRHGRLKASVRSKPYV